MPRLHWGPSRTPSSVVRLGLAHGAHFAAGATAAVEDTGAVGLEATHGDTGGHLEALEDLAGLRIDVAKIALRRPPRCRARARRSPRRRP